MRTFRRSIVSLALAASLTLALGVASGSANLPAPKVTGSGKDGYGLEFSFRAATPAAPVGHAQFETYSFGEPEGDVDCLAIQGRKAGLSGEMETPTSGLTHFMIIVNDRRKRDGRIRDRVVTWMRSGPFDCETEAFGSLSDSLKRLRKGDVRIVRD